MIAGNARLAGELNSSKELGMLGAASIEVDAFSPVNSLRQLTRRVKVLLVYEPDEELIVSPEKLSEKMDIFFQKQGGGGRIRKQKPGGYAAYTVGKQDELEDLNQTLAKK